MMANEKRVAEIMKQFQNLNNNQDDDLAFIKGTKEELLSGLKGVKKTISPTLLVPHPKNVFSMEHDEEYETLKKAIAEYGITNPILCYEDEGKYIILSGHRRTSCAIELGLNAVPVNVIEKFDNDIDALTLLGIENMSTRMPSPIDVALFADEMLTQLKKDKVQGRKRDIIAERIPNIKGRMLQSYMRLLKLPDVFQNWIRQGYLSVKNGERLVSVIGDEKYQESIQNLKEQGEIIINDDIEKTKKEKEISKLIKELITSQKPRKAERVKNVKSEIKKISKVVTELEQTEYTLPKDELEKVKLEKEITRLIISLENLIKEINLI